MVQSLLHTSTLFLEDFFYKLFFIVFSAWTTCRITFFNSILGGVLERNEIFNNKFDGICLATGVEPKLIGKNYT